MTDDEIIKALKHWAKAYNRGCIIAANALDLINRQKAEIDRLKNELHGKVDYVHEQQEIIDELKNNYSKKKITVEFTFNKEQLEKAMQESMRTYILPVNEIRNGGVKDFAIEIEKELMDNANNNGDINSCFVPIIIDRLVKEMTEDENV